MHNSVKLVPLLLEEGRYIHSTQLYQKQVNMVSISLISLVYSIDEFEFEFEFCFSSHLCQKLWLIRD